jgi:hypothetical protein
MGGERRPHATRRALDHGVAVPADLRPSDRATAELDCRGGGGLQPLEDGSARTDPPRRSARSCGRGAGRAVLVAAVPVAGLDPGA